jgi:hypothetical protein
LSVKVEDDEGRVPLLREHERPDHQGPVPLIFDLIDDPVEEWDLLNKTVLVGWVVEPVPSDSARCRGACRSTPTCSRARTSRGTRLVRRQGRRPRLADRPNAGFHVDKV